MWTYLDSLTMKFKEQIKTWYQGKYIPPPENDPDSPFIVLSIGHYEKSTGAKIAEFHLKHWKTLLAVYVTILGILIGGVISLFVYFDPLHKSDKAGKENTQKEQRNPNSERHIEPPNKPKEIDSLKI